MKDTPRGEYRRAAGSGCLLQIIALGCIITALALFEDAPAVGIGAGAIGLFLLYAGFRRARR